MSPVSLFRVSDGTWRIGERREDGGKTVLRFSRVRVSLRACGRASVSFRATAFHIYPGTLIVRISDCTATMNDDSPR